MLTDFAPFPKMARLSRNCLITEKIDGTNAQVCIEPVPVDYVTDYPANCGVWQVGDKLIRAGSRTRWISPGKDKDNYGFSQWVFENKEMLVLLGFGCHYGEWWGSGIQRAYGFSKGERYFSLFNPPRYEGVELPLDIGVRVVPTLYRGIFDINVVAFAMMNLAARGSACAPGFLKPEGIIIYHEAARVSFKKTLEDDEKPKGEVQQ